MFFHFLYFSESLVHFLYFSKSLVHGVRVIDVLNIICVLLVKKITDIKDRQAMS